MREASLPAWLPILGLRYAALYHDSDYLHFKEIKDGTCGPHEGYFAVRGWDFCSGFGSPRVKGFVAEK